MEDRVKNSLSSEEIEILIKRAKEELPVSVYYYAKIMNVQPKGIKITKATTRFGSCSFKNSLCFPYRIMLLPQELINYIIVHELAHIIEKNHSNSFYKVVERYMPDYRKRDNDLKVLSKTLPL